MLTRFYVYEDKVIKVAHKIQSQTAKIVAKPRLNDTHSYPETELTIDPSELDQAYRLCELAGTSQLFESLIIRHDFRYHDVEFALKYSKRWGYHVEAELVIDQQADAAKANETIALVCQELSIALLSPAEEQALERKFTHDGIELGAYDADALPFEL